MSTTSWPQTALRKLTFHHEFRCDPCSIYTGGSINGTPESLDGLWKFIMQNQKMLEMYNAKLEKNDDLE